VVNSNQEVVAPTKGFIKANPDKFTTETAFEHLTNIGIPVNQMSSIHSQGALKHIASIIPKGSKYMGSGAEAIGVRLPNGKLLRIQYNGRKPLNPYDIGKKGTYFDWQTKYGSQEKGRGIYVSQKSFTTHLATSVSKAEREAGMRQIEASYKTYQGKDFKSGAGRKFVSYDLGDNAQNYGFEIVGGKKVWKVTDPGSVRPWGDSRVLSQEY
jgi:hypothetical protein